MILWRFRSHKDFSYFRQSWFLVRLYTERDENISLFSVYIYRKRGRGWDGVVSCVFVPAAVASFADSASRLQSARVMYNHIELCFRTVRVLPPQKSRYADYKNRKSTQTLFFFVFFSQPAYSGALSFQASRRFHSSIDFFHLA